MQADNSLNPIDIDRDADVTGCLPDEEESVDREGTVVYCLEQEFLFHNVPILRVVCNHMFCHKNCSSVSQKLWEQCEHSYSVSYCRRGREHTKI